MFVSTGIAANIMEKSINDQRIRAINGYFLIMSKSINFLPILELNKLLIAKKTPMHNKLIGGYKSSIFREFTFSEFV